MLQKPKPKREGWKTGGSALTPLDNPVCPKPRIKTTNIGAEVGPAERAPTLSQPGDDETLITGEFNYPTPYVLASLGLADWQTEAQKKAVAITSTYRSMPRPPAAENRLPQAGTIAAPTLESLRQGRKKILSIAEGYSGLMPYLSQKANLDVKAVDLCYKEVCPNNALYSAFMKKYEEKYAKNIEKGDATQLQEKEGSQDMVLIHRLLENFEDPKMKAKVIREAFRVLAPGGQIRATGGGPELLLHLPPGEFEYEWQVGAVTAKTKLAYGKPYPSDSFSWDEFQQLLFEPKTGARCLSIDKGFPLPVQPIVVEPNETDMLLIIRKKSGGGNGNGKKEMGPSGHFHP